MKPYLDENNITLYVGDSRAVLAELPDQSVNCCVTSPPYWGLRDGRGFCSVCVKGMAKTQNQRGAI
jgi:DNA modification methylase